MKSKNAIVESGRKSFRRIVTARSDAGRSFLLEDAQVQEGSIGNFNLWQSPESEQFPFVPMPGGNLVRVFRLPGQSGAVSPEELQRQSAEFSAAIGLPGCQPDTGRNPFMHVTPTIDYILLLSGEVSLLLDEGDPIALQPLDVVIQRQTNHAWINTGKSDALLLAVMIART